MNAPAILSAVDGKLVLTLDEGLYPLDVIYGAAYIFIDRAYVLLGRSGEQVTVEIATKDADATPEALRALAGDFSNELLSQTLRTRITRDNQEILEAIVTQAFAGATGVVGPSPFADDVADDDLDFLDDPLGIAVPWEERFDKDDAAPAASSEPEAAPAEDDDTSQGGA